MPLERQRWDGSHEAAVEKFYGVGVENYGEFHGGYLNFGLWEEGIKNYLAAAENLVRTTGRMLGLTPESRLLDVACGMGPQDVFLQKTFGCRIDAIDVTWKHVEHIRRRAAEAGLSDQITAHHGTAVRLPFPDESFTHVLCIEGAEHFDTREAFLKEAYRVLRPGGAIALADYVVKRPARSLYERFVLEAARALWHVPKANYEDTQSYGKTMERCGFHNVTVKEVGVLTIPGYYLEQQRPEVIAALSKIRGPITTRLSWFVDYAMYKAFKDGLIEYVLARGEK